MPVSNACEDWSMSESWPLAWASRFYEIFLQWGRANSMCPLFVDCDIFVSQQLPFLSPIGLLRRTKYSVVLARVRDAFLYTNGVID
jgi:hypothetical protein